MNVATLMLRIGILSCLVFSSCSILPMTNSPEEAAVVYALGTREGFSSPLNQTLRPACAALEFRTDSYLLTGGHHKVLSGLIADWEKRKTKFLVAGYAQPGLPEDYARVLSERRAQAVRQYLIENSVEASHLQTVGFGFDSSPNSPNSNLVVIYLQ